jgi:predicted acylesterase/phospholipase RssA
MDMSSGSVDLADQASYMLPVEAGDCDMVMKGGITSGVVYPRAVCQLATSYRFRRLGGASAGAIAATMAAAAEAGRSSGGFRRLNDLPDQLGQKLRSMFQPSMSTVPAFDALSAWIESDCSTFRKGRRVLWLAVRHSRFAWATTFVLAIAAAAAFDLWLTRTQNRAGEWWKLAGALLVWLPVAFFLSFTVSVLVLLRRTLKALPTNGYGLCDGHTVRPGGSDQPLTDWMAEQLERLAGKDVGKVPLTFGDLWGRRATEAYRAAMRPGVGESQLPDALRRGLRDHRDVDVLVMATDLTHRRPYSFPFDTQVFHWCPDCLDVYFPKHVVRHMEATSDEVADESSGGHSISKLCPVHIGKRLRYLPLAPDIPLVVAARLSLSFPGLISALPFYAVDWAAPAGDRRVVPVWFSDGGIASNFPMHFFDRPWPRRPTFGINLLPVNPGYPDQMTWRPTTGAAGILPRYRPMDSVIGFAKSILDTMQNWSDNTQITMPGFRDRVVEVRLRSDEGGMNLRMAAPVITRLADRGSEAAGLFDSFDLAVHRWIRHRVAMSSLDELLSTMHDAYGGPEGYEQFIADYGPTTKHYTAGTEDGAATSSLMATLDTWAALDHPSTQGSVPRPKPSLRPVPRQ